MERGRDRNRDRDRERRIEERERERETREYMQAEREQEVIVSEWFSIVYKYFRWFSKRSSCHQHEEMGLRHKQTSER